MKKKTTEKIRPCGVKLGGWRVGKDAKDGIKPS